MKRWEIAVLVASGLILALAVFILPAKCFGEELPPAPAPVEPGEDWIHGTIGKGDIDTLDDVVAGDTICQQKLDDGGYKLMSGGILMSEGKAKYFANVKISYKELRLLYQVDIARWDATFDVYTQQLDSAQNLVEKLTKEKKRSWWEKNDFQIGLAIGVVLTIGVMVGAGALMAYVGE
jgi:hypothetical protein